VCSVAKNSVAKPLFVRRFFRKDNIMNLLAAAATPTQSAPAYNPAYQNQAAYQNTTVQPDRPAPKPSWKAKVFSYGFLFGYIAVVLFFIVMIYRFVKAFEKIANSMDKGIVIKKDDTTT
jgi:hypothetical protein